MSYGSTSISVGDALYFIKFPDLVRVNDESLAIQVHDGWLIIEGEGMQFLFLDLLAGKVSEIARGRMGPFITIGDIRHRHALRTTRIPSFAAECCPVPSDLVLMETKTFKDYLARSSLCFFGRLGRQGRKFIVGFVDRSYEITAFEGEADDLASTVLANRMAIGSPNIITSISPEHLMPWFDICRYCVAEIEETEHRPDEWDSFGDGVRIQQTPNSSFQTVSTRASRLGSGLSI